MPRYHAPQHHFTTRTDIIEEDAEDFHLRQVSTNGRSSSSRSGAVYRPPRSNSADRAQGDGHEPVRRGLEWLGLQGLFAEKHDGRGTSWSYVGDGKGAYEQMEEFRYVGEGAGNFEKREDTEIRPSRFKPGCMVLGLLLFGLAVLATVLAVGLHSASSHEANSHEAQQLQTTLLADATVGAVELSVMSEEGFEEGDSIIISDGYSSSETKTISAFGSILLSSPLERPFAAGSAVTKTEAPHPAVDVLLSEEVHPEDTELQVSSLGNLALNATVQIGRHHVIRTVVAFKWKHRVVVDCALQRAFPAGTRVRLVSGRSGDAAHWGSSTCGHEDPFDCDAGLPKWKTGWSEEKKEWCCENKKKGCEDPFDCDAGLPKWKTGWSKEKKEWCCENKEKGCQPADPFDCSAGLPKWKTGWSEEKKEWCCENKEKGCQPADPFDCSAGLPKWKTGWSEEKKEWCCENKKKGCQDPFDCSAGLPKWKTGWSEKKKEWCCENKKKGCQEVTTTTTTSSFYDCSAGISDWEFGWTPMKLAWCCGHDRNLSSCPLVGTSAPFDCAAGLSNWEKGWSSGKQEWCCRNQAVACSYSCNPSEEKQESWTFAKREWCCEHWGRGCESHQPDVDTTCDGGLDLSDVAYSNLGDQGPDFGREPAIRYRNICEVGSQPVDLVLRAKGDYEPALARHNGHNGLVGRINVKYGTSVDLVFAFVKAGGDVPVQVPRVLFTVLDIDRSEAAAEAESVLIKNFSLFYLDNDTTVHYQPVGPGGARFSSTRMGDLTDNPSNMSNLSSMQRREAVTLLFLNSSSFPVSFEASGKKKDQGRVFMFGGKRDLSASHGTLVGPAGFVSPEAGWREKPEHPVAVDRGQGPERPAQGVGAARLTCRLDCSVNGAARPVKLHVGRTGDSFVPAHAATGGLDREGCGSACLATPGCDGVTYGNGTCYGVWEVRTSECKRGDIGDYQTQFLTGRPWGRCALVSHAHVVTFDRMYGPDLAEYEPADYHLVRSDHLEVQARLDRTAASPEASSIVGIAVTGALLGGRALVVEYLGPTLGRRGFRVTWDGEEILAEYPSRYRATDGVLSARHWRGDPAWRHWQARNILSNYSDSLPSYFFQFPPHLDVHMLLGPDSCGVILAMQKLGVGQEGLCGNFNCDGIDDAYKLLEDRGRVAPVRTGESLFRSRRAGQDGAVFQLQQSQRRKELSAAREACAVGLLREAEAACAEAVPKGLDLQMGCIAEACSSNSSGLAEMQAAVHRLEPGLLAPR